MPRRNEANFNFWYDEKWYSVQGAETMVRIGTKDDMATMRSEYTRMRDTAQKRLQRLAKQFPESKAVQSHPQGFKKLKELDPRDFPKAFAELAKFLRAKGSTVSGQRAIKQKTMETWQKQGLPVNERNYQAVIKVLEEARKQKLVYGSDKMVEAAETMLERTSLDQEMWLAHLDTILSRIDDIKEIPNLEGYDFDEIMEMLGE